MKEWFAGLQSRERTTLIGGAAVLLIMVLYFGVWEPLHRAVAELEQEVAAQRDLYRWMQRAADQVDALQTSDEARVSDNRSLLAVVDRTAKHRGKLGSAVKRIEPEGQRSVRVWLDDASFDDLVRWLGRLRDQYSVQVASLSVERGRQGSGQVNARITLERGVA